MIYQLKGKTMRIARTPWTLSITLLLLTISILKAQSAYCSVYLYIGHGSGTPQYLSVIDTSTNVVIATIPVPLGVSSVAVHPLAPIVYLAGGKGIDILDATTNRISANISIVTGVDETGGVAVSPNGAFVYRGFSGRTYIVSTSTNKVTSTIEGYGYPIVPSPDGSMLYVTSGGATGVIDTATNTRLATFYGKPLAIHPMGTYLYARAPGGGEILVIDTITRLVSATISFSVSSEIGIAVDPTGNYLYLPDYGLGTLSVYARSNYSKIATVPVGGGPLRVAVHPNGTLVYVMNQISGTISVVDAVTNTLKKTINIGEHPHACGITPDLPVFRAVSYYAHAALGGGWGTSIDLINTGKGAFTGNLVLKDGSGNPLTDATVSEPTALREGGVAVPLENGKLSLSIPEGGTKSIVATRPAANSPKNAWAFVESPGGTIDGVATFGLTQDGFLKAAAGVLASQPLDCATIFADYDIGANRFTGFAVANPTTEDVRIKLITLNEQGTVVDTITPPELNPLKAQGQVARYLHEYLATRSRFKGSLLLISQGTQKFVALALGQNQNVLTAIPVIPGIPPNVPR